MNASSAYHLAIDLGAGSGRVMALDLRGAAPALTEVHRFVGEPVSTPTGAYWNVLQILTEIRLGIARARDKFGASASSLAVDSWGVDYTLLDSRGCPLGPPYFYRDTRTAGADARLRQRLPDAELFRRTGSQPRAINTIYQLLTEQAERPAALAAARRIAFIPDLINYWLTGEFSHENTIAATSGLWNPATRDWHSPLIDELGLPDGIFPPLQEPGTIAGYHEKSPVLLCASHDTASAIHAVQGEPGQAILSLGSWAIVSWSLNHPGLSAEVGAAGFAVEGCPRGHWRYARNHTGLWLMQRYRGGLVGGGHPADYAALEAAAAQAAPESSVVNPDDPAFTHPSDMAAAMAEQLHRSGQAIPETPGAWARLIYRSLAVNFADSLVNLARVTGEPVRSVRVIGGGAQSALLCQMIADATALPVIAGPVEATAWGNLLVQLQSLHDGDTGDWRNRFAPAWAEHRYAPRPSTELARAQARR